MHFDKLRPSTEARKERKTTTKLHAEETGPDDTARRTGLLSGTDIGCPDGDDTRAPLGLDKDATDSAKYYQNSRQNASSAKAQRLADVP